jgi:beta-mannosidase
MLWDKAWGGHDRQPDRFYGENIYNKVIPEVLAQLDPTRPYTPSSPWGGKPCSSDSVGDQHNWDVWHGGDWGKYTESNGRFISEFGFAAAPSLDLWQNWIDTEDWSEDSPVVRWHDKTGKTFDTFAGYVKLHYPESESLEDWTYYSQLNQRDALRYGIEHYRRSEFCKGTLVWQLNDCWPVQSWALIDSEGNWKAAAHEMRRVFADQLVTISRKGSKVQVHVVNDGVEPIEGSLLIAYIKSTVTGETLRSLDVDVALDSSERKVALEFDIEGFPAPETVVEAQWIGIGHAWRFVCEPKEVRFANPTIKFGIDSDGQAIIQSDLPVVDLMLFDESGSQAFLDNFVTLLDAIPVPVDLVDGAQVGQLIGRSLAGYHRIRMVRGPF